MRMCDGWVPRLRTGGRVKRQEENRMVEVNSAFVSELAKCIVSYLPPPTIYEVFTFSELARTKISLGFFNNLEAAKEAENYLISQADEHHLREINADGHVKSTFDPKRPYHTHLIGI